MINVLFVCLGNICRSPLAEAIFADMIRRQGLQDQVSTDSCGTSNYHIGENPDPRSVQTAHNHAIPINHKGKQLVEHDFRTFEYIVPMDSSNLLHCVAMQSRVPQSQTKVVLMRDYDQLSPGADVPDPYYGGDRGFEEVYEMLHRACNKLLEEIKAELPAT